MGYDIPLFDLNYGPEEEEAVLRTLRSRWISMGPNCQKVEEAFAARFEVKHVLALTNCTAALHLALAALDIGEGDEVIVPSLTFVATVNAVRYVGATPVFADIRSRNDLSIDPDDVDSLITPRTKAIMPMHYGGFSADMDRLAALARKRNIALVEDAAHAPTSDWKGQALGTLGDAGCYSFFSNKNITCAEGGLLVTSRDDIAERVRLMRSHGMTSLSLERARGHATSYDVVELGYNYRLDDIRGALLLAQMDRLDEDYERREALRQHYLTHLAGIDDIVVPYRDFDHRSSNYIMPVVLCKGGAAQRDAVRQSLAELGIQTSVHYPAVHRFSIYAPYRRPLPLTEMVTDHEITLPMYPTMTTEQVERVCRCLRDSL